MFYEDLDHGFGVVDKVVWIEFQFLKLGIFSDEVFDRVFQNFDDAGEGRFVGRCLNVKDDLVVDS